MTVIVCSLRPGFVAMAGDTSRHTGGGPDGTKLTLDMMKVQSFPRCPVVLSFWGDLPVLLDDEPCKQDKWLERWIADCHDVDTEIIANHLADSLRNAPVNAAARPGGIFVAGISQSRSSLFELLVTSRTGGLGVEITDRSLEHEPVYVRGPSSESWSAITNHGGGLPPETNDSDLAIETKLRGAIESMIRYYLNLPEHQRKVAGECLFARIGGQRS